MSYDVDDVEGVSPTLHEINEAANATSWNNIRFNILCAITESFALQIDTCCCMCGEAAKCRCVQCGATIYYCLKCCEECHSKANIFHAVEVWDVRC